MTTEAVNHSAYNYEAQIASVTYGAATAINTYPMVGGQALTYIDSYSQARGLHSSGALHHAGDGWWRYYNTQGQLTHAATSGPVWQTYVYDALGERIQVQRQDDPDNRRLLRTVSDGLRPETVREVDYVWTSYQPSWAYTGTRAYVLGPLPDERLIWMEGRGEGRVVSYPHTDRRGSTIAMARGGQAVSTYGYDEFGRGRAGDGVTGYPFRYTGQRLDPWTGTYHYKAREYSPNLGRFLQPDPARFVDGPNIYAYVGNNPWNATDPTGMVSCPPDSKPGDCVDDNTAPQPGPDEETTQLDDIVVTARRERRFTSGEAILFPSSGDLEQGFRVGPDGIYPIPFSSSGTQQCTNGTSRRANSINRAGIGDDSGGHTHGGGDLNPLPGPEDGVMAAVTGRTAYQMSARGAFAIENTASGYRVRRLSGRRLSPSEQDELLGLIRNWNQNNGGSGATCTFTPDP